MKLFLEKLEITYLKGFISVVVWALATVAIAENYTAGAASIVVTPPAGTLLAGYGRDRLSSGMHDELFAKAVVIHDGLQGLAIVTVDCIGLTRPDILMIQKTVSRLIPDIDANAVIISSTHTHAGPDVVGLWGKNLWSNGRDESYMSNLRRKIVEVIVTADDKSVAVTSQVAATNVIFNWVENRSEPGLLDSVMSVVQFVDMNGIVIATLTNYACHPTVLGGDNTFVSADYLSGFYRTMSTALPGEHLFLQGAIGGWVQPLQGDRSIELARNLGSQLGEKSIQLLKDAVPNPFYPIRLRHQEFDIDVENWRFRLMMWLGVLNRETYDGAMRTESVWFQIGKTEFVTHPGETSPAYSIASRKLMTSEYGFVLGLSQDAIGYILKPEYFSDEVSFPHGEYLRTVSVGRNAGPTLLDVLGKIVPSKSGGDVSKKVEID